MRKYAIFATLALVLFFSTFNGTALAVGLPTIISSFHSSLILGGWIVSGYLLTFTISGALGGRMSDSFGRKRVFLICLAIFIAASFLCALAPTLLLLILARCLQGVGAGVLGTCAVGIVSEEFPHVRQKAIGLLMSLYPFGMIAGPILGGWMVHSWGWRSIFWINAPMMILAFVASSMMLRSGQNKEEGSLDLAGAGLFAGFLGTLMVGLSLIHHGRTPWPAVATLITLSIVFVFLFLRRESRVKNPIIDLDLLRRGPFLAANSYSFLFGICTNATAVFVPMYAVAVYHQTTLGSGAIMTPRSLGMLVASTITSFFLVRWGYRWPMLIGSALIGMGFVFLAIQPHHMSLLGWSIGGTGLILLILGISGLGLGAVVPPANNACIDLMPQRVATIVGLRTTFLNAGSSVGMVILSLILDSHSDLSRGFFLVFGGLAVITFASIPLIFAMPNRVHNC